MICGNKRQILRERGLLMGLKNMFKGLQGTSLGYRLRHIKYELKYAWQRAWRGYDDSMVFNIDHTFIELYKEIFKTFKENLYFYPATMTEKEWNDTLDKMIKCLDKMYHILYESDNDDVVLIEDEKNEFFELFNKHFWDLWN